MTACLLYSVNAPVYGWGSSTSEGRAVVGVVAQVDGSVESEPLIFICLVSNARVVTRCDRSAS